MIYVIGTFIIVEFVGFFSLLLVIDHDPGELNFWEKVFLWLLVVIAAIPIILIMAILSPINFLIHGSSNKPKEKRKRKEKKKNEPVPLETLIAPSSPTEYDI
jgi:hypothetical protein